MCVPAVPTPAVCLGSGRPAHSASSLVPTAPNNFAFLSTQWGGWLATTEAEVKLVGSETERNVVVRSCFEGVSQTFQTSRTFEPPKFKSRVGRRAREREKAWRRGEAQWSRWVGKLYSCAVGPDRQHGMSSSRHSAALHFSFF